MDNSSDKQAKSHTRKLGYGFEMETLREKENLFWEQHKKRHKDQLFQNRNR